MQKKMVTLTKKTRQKRHLYNSMEYLEPNTGVRGFSFPRKIRELQGLLILISFYLLKSAKTPMN